MKTRLSLLLPLLLLTPANASPQDFPQIRTLASSMAGDLKKANRKTIAVVDFTDLQGSVTELGRFLAEEFSVALSGHADFETIDRTHLRAIIAEHKLSASGLIDPQTSRKLGQIAGVDTLLTGTLTPFGESVRLTLKLLDVSTARVVSASTADIPRTKAIDELLSASLTAPGSVGRPAPSGAARPAPLMTQAAHGVSFGLENCQRRAGNVVCTLRLTNESEDRRLTLNSGRFGVGLRTRAFDQAGNESFAATIAVANDSDESRVTKTLISGVPTAGAIVFDGVGATATVFTLLEICGYVDAQDRLSSGPSDQSRRTGSSGDFVLKFRNVPIR